MRVGLTYDLRSEYLALGWSEQDVAEFDREDTIVSLENALRAAECTPDRIGGADALMNRLARGDRWDLVLNIAEGRYGVGREALVPAILDHAQVPYTFGDPLCCVLTLDKPACKRLLRDHGLPTPEFAVITSPADVGRMTLPFPVFVKPSREGSSKGVDERSVCRSRAELKNACERLLGEFNQPVLVESFMPGEEVTVGILGTGHAAEVIGVLGVGLRDTSEVYGYEDKERCEELVEYLLVDSSFASRAAALALAAYRAAGCRDAGRVDVRADATGAPCIIEVNALPGLHPTHSDLPIMAGLAGMSYGRLIERILRSAEERMPSRRDHQVPADALTRCGSSACGC